MNYYFTLIWICFLVDGIYGKIQLKSPAPMFKTYAEKSKLLDDEIEFDLNHVENSLECFILFHSVSKAKAAAFIDDKCILSSYEIGKNQPQSGLTDPIQCYTKLDSTNDADADSDDEKSDSNEEKSDSKDEKSDSDDESSDTSLTTTTAPTSGTHA